MNMCSLYMFSFVDKYYTQERARVSMSVGYSSVAVNLRVLCISSKTTKDTFASSVLEERLDSYPASFQKAILQKYCPVMR